MRWKMMCCICAAVFLAGAAHADRPLLPAPISSGELDAYGRRLALSEAQMQAWRRSLVEYQAAFRERRTAFLDDLAPLRAQVGEVPDLVAARVADEFFSAHRRAMEALLAMDRGVLESIDELLAQEQRSALPAVIDARTLRFWFDNELVHRWFWVDRLTDWRDAIERAGIDAAHHEDVEAIVRDAERLAASNVAVLYRRATRAHLDWTRAMERVEFEPDEPDGVSYSARLSTYVEIGEEARQAFARLFDLDHRTLMRLVHALPAEESWALFSAAIEGRGFGMIPLHITRADQIIDRARVAFGEDEAKHEAFARGVRSAVIEHADRAIASYNEWRTLRPPPIGAALDERANFNVAEQRDLLNARVRDQLAALGPDRAAELEAIWNPPAGAPATPEQQRASMIERHAADLAPDHFVPGPLTRDVLRIFADAAELDADRRAIANLLHEEYERSFLRIRRAEVDEVVAIFIGWRMGEQSSGRPRYSEPDEVNRKRDTRRSARQRIAAIDEAFINDLAASVLDEGDDDALALLRLARAGQAHTRGMRAGIYLAGDYVPFRACVVAAVDRAELSRESRAAALAALAGRADALIALMRRMSEAEMRVEHIVSMTTAYMVHRPDEIPTLDESPTEAVDELRQARRAVAREQAAAIETIAEALPEEEAEQLRESYLRLAYPSVWSDENAKHEAFRAALAQPSPPGEVRATLAERWLEYVARYRALSRRMAEVMASATHAGVAIDEESRAEIERIARQVEAIRLERDELNEEAKIALAGANR